MLPKTSKYVLCIFIVLISGWAQAKKKAKNNKEQVVEQTASYGSSQANPGGEFVINLQDEPSSIHPISSMSLSALSIHDWTMGTLLSKDPRTYDWKPMIADRWEISKDGRMYTFWLRHDVVFHDGSAMTAEDVKFSFDAIFKPEYNAAAKIPYFENILKVEVVDPYVVKFYAKDGYFLNFDVIAGMYILPKKIYGDVERSQKMNRELIGCGPYKLESYDSKKGVVVKKFAQWFGGQLPAMQGLYNFDSIRFRFVKDDIAAASMLERGEIDFQEITLDQYAQKNDGEPWSKLANKLQVENLTAKSYRFIAWHMDHPIFKDKNIRKALAMLLNREEINQKFYAGLMSLATGPTDVFSDYASAAVKPVAYEPAKALSLLQQSGWKDSDKDGVLDKIINGKKVDFRFTLLHANKEHEKMLSLYREDLKKVGIDMQIKYLDWNTFLKTVDAGKFEAMSMAWTTAIEFDPKPQWHSSSAVSGGSNFSRYRSSEVDQLIDNARFELDRNKRIQILKKAYEHIAGDFPYVFMFNQKQSYYVLNSRIGQLLPTYKYSLGLEAWWVKPNIETKK